MVLSDDNTIQNTKCALCIVFSLKWRLKAKIKNYIAMNNNSLDIN
jgi:hypothetical protein